MQIENDILVMLEVFSSLLILWGISILTDKLNALSERIKPTLQESTNVTCDGKDIAIAQLRGKLAVSEERLEVTQEDLKRANRIEQLSEQEITQLKNKNYKLTKRIEKMKELKPTSSAIDTSLLKDIAKFLVDPCSVTLGTRGTDILNRIETILETK